MTLPEGPIRAVRHAQRRGNRADHLLYQVPYGMVMPMDYPVRQVGNARRIVAVIGFSEALATGGRSTFNRACV